jgi:hypothetical protein
MYSDTNTTRSVADAVMKVMNEKLHPNQQKLDVHEPEKDELTADDFKKLRAGKKDEVKKEEVEAISETDNTDKIEEASDFVKGVKRFVAGKKNPSDVRDSHLAKSTFSSDPKVKEKESRRYDKVQNVISKEEVEQEETILEYESKDGKFVHNAKTGRYGGSEKPTDPFAGVRGPGQKDLEKIEKEKKKKKFSEMVNLYQEKGLKSLSEMLVKEEPTNDEYKAELEDVKAKASGAKKNPDIAKGKVDAVKQEEVEVIEEKTLTEPEMKKREEIVMSMKKGMAGFKERYGDRAKNVMYATATKQAKKSA